MSIGFTDRSGLQPTSCAERQRRLTVACRIIERRSRAVLVADIASATTAWLPRSEVVIHDYAAHSEIILPTWLAIEKGISAWTRSEHHSNGGVTP